MATITGLTAERMLEVEANSVVDGDIIAEHLILTKHNGETIDAGSVVGPEGPVGPAGPSGCPVGAILDWPAIAPPAGWLLCDGTSYLRATYPNLFNALGGISSLWGLPDGTHFNVPNLKGKVRVGLDTAQSEFNVLGETGGAKTHTLTENELAPHDHVANGGNATVVVGGTGGPPGGYGGYVFVGLDIEDAGGGAAHNNLQPYVTMPQIIKHDD